MSQATATSPSIPARVQRALMRGAGHLPPALLRLGAQFGRVNADGERLSPEMALTGWIAAHLPAFELAGKPVDRARADLTENAATLTEKLPPMAVEEDLEIDGPGGAIPATRYRARVDSVGLVVFFHGGGFVQGDRVSHDNLVRRLALSTGADILSVDYRLAPEHPFPAAVDDAVAAWRFAVAKAPGWGVRTDRIAVAGDSAGGNLSAVVAQQVRGDEVTPCLQMLIYPVTDVTTKRDSRREFAEGLYLTDAHMDWFVDHYVPDVGQRADPRVSPLLADDLSGLAPAYVIVAGFDPLRDEGIAYADRLKEAGVPVTLDRAGSLIHAFANMTLISPDARAAVDRIGAALAFAMR
ncbi:alpha/beta hydrolase [Gordonia sp. OPL2]|uniref:alpha/beta hydrolase n=1 Tax=Gordonia sp. OPL2 TaxID=2486274 RepID=UPI0021CC58EE|nr:alpha/beta hydrolase [Gordonia sp. OPL2]ROZ98072.1 alpha/beta hydrolase [Gordonia sp. OPL2]